MKRRQTLTAVIGFATVVNVALTGVATASPNLQITEMWAGGVSGAEATSDWFELTNFGNMAAVGLDGNLYYDDDSADPTKNDPLTGIDSIAPGESVVYLVSWDDDYATEADAIAAFRAMWDAPAGDLTGVQIGIVDGGSGLGSGGDAAFIFDGNTVSATTIDSAQYSAPGATDANFASYIPAADGTYGFPSVQSVDGVLGAYTGNFAAGDGIVTDDLGNVIESIIVPNAVGSPGFANAPVPEPSAIMLVTLAVASGTFVARYKS